MLCVAPLTSPIVVFSKIVRRSPPTDIASLQLPFTAFINHESIKEEAIVKAIKSNTEVQVNIAFKVLSCYIKAYFGGGSE